MRRNLIVFWACRRFSIYLQFVVRDAVALYAPSFASSRQQKDTAAIAHANQHPNSVGALVRHSTFAFRLSTFD